MIAGKEKKEKKRKKKRKRKKGGRREGGREKRKEGMKEERNSRGSIYVRIMKWLVLSQTFASCFF